MYKMIQFLKITLVDSIVKWTSDGLKDKETIQYLYIWRKFQIHKISSYFELFDAI